LLKVKTLVDESRLQKNKEAAKQSITLQKSLQQLQETIKSDSYDAQKVNSQLDSVQATLGEIKALLNDPLSQDDKTL
jgi:phosphomevalonate kinase